jgi:hypothetical protein
MVLTLQLRLRRVLRLYLSWPSARLEGYHLRWKFRASFRVPFYLLRFLSCRVVLDHFSLLLGIDVEPLSMFPPCLAWSTILASKALIQTTCPFPALVPCVLFYALTVIAFE